MALLTYFPVTQGGAGTTVVAAAVANQKHKVIGLALSLLSTGSFKFTGASDLTGNIRALKDASICWPSSTIPYLETASGEALSIVTVGGAGAGVIVYITEP